MNGGGFKYGKHLSAFRQLQIGDSLARDQSYKLKSYINDHLR